MTLNASPATLLFRQALSHFRAARWPQAGLDFAAAYRADPQQPEPAQGMLECALHLARADIAPPHADMHDPARVNGRISIVVCSNNAQNLARLRVDLDRHFTSEDWELIHIADAHSLCEGYSRGLLRARGDLLVFCHDDIGILCDDFAERLRRRLAEHDLVGVAGCDRLTGPIWAWAGTPHTANWVCSPSADGALNLGVLGITGETLPAAQALDGVFLAGHRHVFESVPFDAETFDGFHFYDLDLSYRAHRAGLNCAVALDLLLWHASGGNYGNPAWQHYARRFTAKFPELYPTAPMAAFRPGQLTISDPLLVGSIYRWIAHWQNPAE